MYCVTRRAFNSSCRVPLEQLVLGGGHIVAKLIDFLFEFLVSRFELEISKVPR